MPQKVNLPLIKDVDKIPLLPIKNDLKVIKFIEDNHELYAKLVLKKLQLAIKRNEHVIYLFRVGDSHDNIAWRIEKNKFQTEIERLMQFFVKHEDYENANICKLLLTEFQVNELIETSK